MNWREHVWEGIVAALSWIVALVVLACIAVFVAIDLGKRYRSQQRARRAQKMTAMAARSSRSILETMELAS